MNVREMAMQMKQDAPALAASTMEERNTALLAAADALRAHADGIFAANAEDLAAAERISDAVKKRLKFDEHKLEDVIAGIHQLVSLPDPLGKRTLYRELDADLVLERLTVPIGVIGVIFEARPDALVQISALCIKSGNCAVLKGGSEAARTNKALFDVIYNAVINTGLPAHCLAQVSAHSEIDELLTCDHEVDLLIPRGSNAFVRYIMDHTKIPVMGHADGICHTYLDRAADLAKALPVLADAKTQYVAACNATETVLIDRAAAETLLPAAAKALSDAGVVLHGNAEVCGLLAEAAPEISVLPMEEADYATEYLNMEASLKLVDGVREAVEHINRYGSHHTDAILTEDDEAAAYFLRMVDSAGVYHNASTRFADGFRYGFGAEVGISTGKIHARGPVGLEGLVTYKYCLHGDGQIVGDYASGAKQFHFRNL